MGGGDGLIARFYDIGDGPLTGIIETSFPFLETWKTDLNEQPGKGSRTF
jgi:hypothetical protein